MAETETASAATTRELLLGAAVQLFAERGLDNVSLAEINRAAGQRNATAAHYHFGGKDGLLQAIFDKHRPRVDVLRVSLLRELPANAGPLEVVPVLVVPLAEQVRDPDGGVHYLRFLAQLMNRGEFDFQSTLDQHPSQEVEEQARRFGEALAHLPSNVRELRMGFVVNMIFNSLARYADRVSESGLDEALHARFISELTAAAVGALQAT